MRVFLDSRCLIPGDDWAKELAQAQRQQSNLPMGLSFLGPAFSDARLLGLAHAFERATKARRVPVTTPPLPGERFED